MRASPVDRLGRALALLTALWLSVATASAHDASAYGGVFRSRNMGGSWLGADVGLFLNVPLAVAVDPHEPAHLLLGTELGLLESTTGGRSWRPEAQGLIVGPVFAIGFVGAGGDVLCGTATAVFRRHDGGWQRIGLPDGAVPVRAIAADIAAGRVFLLGRDRLLASEDEGATYRALETDPGIDQPLTALAVAGTSLAGVAAGQIVTSADGGAHWQPSPLPPRVAAIDALDADPAIAGRLWAAGDDRLVRSDDRGATWAPAGERLPDAHTLVRGVAADATGQVLVVSTHRGLYRSEDAGFHWQLLEGALPVHLEAGPLFRDPADARIIYAVFSLLPYGEVWRMAAAGPAAARGLPAGVLASCALFLLLLFGAGFWAVRALARERGPAPSRARAAR